MGGVGGDSWENAWMQEATLVKGSKRYVIC
jgi:hypothetical protein